MSTGNHNELVEKDFVMPVTTSCEFSPDDLAEDTEGLQLDFPRIKIPAGGVLQFELVTDNPENPEYISTLDAVILFNHSYNAYWENGFEDEEEALPLCSSFDGKIGYGTPGGTCLSCEFNRFGSDEKGKGKACSATRSLMKS